MARARTKFPWFVAGGAIGLAAALAILCVASAMREQAKEGSWAAFDTEQMGIILLLFVEDQGRMPADLGELYQKGYIETREDGRAYPGMGIVGRPSAGSGRQVHDLPFQSLWEVRVRYGAAWRERDVIEGPGRSVYVKNLGHLYSALIGELLEKKEQARGRPQSRSWQSERPGRLQFLLTWWREPD